MLPMLPSVVVVSAPAPAVLEVLPVGYGVELDVADAGVLDDDAAGVLPPLVPDADVLPMLPSAIVASAPAVLEVLPVGYGVELDVVGAGVLDDDAAGVLPPVVPDADVLPMLPSAVVAAAPSPAGYGVELDVVSSSPPDDDVSLLVVGVLFTAHFCWSVMIYPTCFWFRIMSCWHQPFLSCISYRV